MSSQQTQFTPVSEVSRAGDFVAISAPRGTGRIDFVAAEGLIPGGTNQLYWLRLQGIFANYLEPGRTEIPLESPDAKLVSHYLHALREFLQNNPPLPATRNSLNLAEISHNSAMLTLNCIIGFENKIGTESCNVHFIKNLIFGENSRDILEALSNAEQRMLRTQTSREVLDQFRGHLEQAQQICAVLGGRARAHSIACCPLETNSQWQLLSKLGSQLKLTLSDFSYCEDGSEHTRNFRGEVLPKLVELGVAVSRERRDVFLSELLFEKIQTAVEKLLLRQSWQHTGVAEVSSQNWLLVAEFKR